MNQLLAKAASSELESEDSGEEEGGVTMCLLLKDALLQVSHITGACCYPQQPQLIESNYRLDIDGQSTQQNTQKCFLY